MTVAVIVTDPALMVRTSAVRGPVAATVATAVSLLVHATLPEATAEPSAALAVARTSSESPRIRVLFSASMWTVLMDAGDPGNGVVDSLQAVSIAVVSTAAASIIVRTFVMSTPRGFKQDANW
ncbi:MAG: hypothetical protein ABIR58_06245 [Gemmatimonadaceae bacterium]